MTGGPLNGGTCAPRYLPAMQPPVGVPGNGPWSTAADDTLPSGAKVTVTWPVPVGPSAFLHDWTLTAPRDAAAAPRSNGAPPVFVLVGVGGGGGGGGIGSNVGLAVAVRWAVAVGIVGSGGTSSALSPFALAMRFAYQSFAATAPRCASNFAISSSMMRVNLSRGCAP